MALAPVPGAPRAKPVAPFRGAAGPGYTASQVANPNDPAVAARLRAADARAPGDTSLGTLPPGFAAALAGTPAGGTYPDPYGTTDPILQKIQAANVTARTNARTAELAAAKQLAIGLGDATGFGLDQTTQDEATGNPYSTLATLLKGYKDTSLAHDEQLNNNNLFFSGARVKQLGEDADQYQHGIYDARSAALGQYGQLQSNLASALTGADQSDMTAEGDAYGRAQQRALAYGYDPGQITDTANTNLGPAAKATTPGYGTTTSSAAGLVGQGLAAALARQPKLTNPYVTGQKARG